MVCHLAADGTKFQSTLPCRERLKGTPLIQESSDFNPRSRVGSDVTQQVQASAEQLISIHAPV